MSTLWQVARECLLTTDIKQKLDLTRDTAEDWCNGYLSFDSGAPPEPECEAGLPPTLQLVKPAQLPRRKLTAPGGREALLHAIAHIEFNAINLAWDAVYRFRGLPRAYYSDWVGVAAEEAYHFSLMQQHLRDIGLEYGDLPAHDGLWRMACNTAHDPMVRMALVPRVLEARGLDVTPGMIERLKGIGDKRAVGILRIILDDEIGHVAIGSRWFRYLCERRGLDPEPTYLKLYGEFFDHPPSGTLNQSARREAGFGERELAFLAGADS